MVWHRVTSISSHKLEQAPLAWEAQKVLYKNIFDKSLRAERAAKLRILIVSVVLKLMFLY